MSSINEWSPDLDKGTTIDMGFLRRAISISSEDKLNDIKSEIDQDVISQYAPYMRLDMKPWQIATEHMSFDEVVHLIYFFTVAEVQLPGWEAADKSPVIWLFKILKQRKTPLDKAVVKWIKSHSNNRFLPYGSVL